MQYLSDQWILAADEAVKHLAPLPTSLVAGYVVDGAQPYSVYLGSDTVSVRSGVQDANITFCCDWDLACDIALGRRSAQRAFLDGELRIKGDVNLLLGHAKAFGVLQDCLAPLRADTNYSD